MQQRPVQPKPKNGASNAYRYATWRHSDRRYSKVHLLDDDAQPLCGRTPGRELGHPKPPIPESAFCEACLKLGG
ncbi:MAG: hypothetical protein M3295_04695 [Chloroflexota bacterium]|nr:hypothetical protein [Chloroflexota bacterium]